MCPIKLGEHDMIEKKLIDKKVSDVINYLNNNASFRNSNSKNNNQGNELYGKWDALAKEQKEFYNYIICENKHLELINKKESCTNIKYATFFSDLGVVSPSKFTKHIIKGYKSGRIIKNYQHGMDFVNKIYFEDDGTPLCIECFCGFEKDNPKVKKAVTETYFVQYNGCIWTVCFFCESGKLFEDNNCYKIVEENGLLLGYYSMQASKGTAIITAQEFDYSAVEDGIVWCLYSDYVEGLSGTSKDIAPGFKNSPMEQWKYKIYLNEKGKYAKYELYKNIEGDFKMLHEKCLLK